MNEYPRAVAGSQPEYLYEQYRSTIRRAPSQPQILLPHTLSELTGPVYGHNPIGPTDNDLTCHFAAPPQGERIVVAGRILDEDGRGVPHAMVEIWQTNAAGRYRHTGDNHPAPLDPNFLGAGRTIADAAGNYRFVTIKPFDPVLQSIPDRDAQQRLVSRFDLSLTEPEWALGYCFDIVLRGRRATPFEEGGECR